MRDIMSSAVMDTYLNASDSMTFQEMLDIDIKSEIESLVTTQQDFSGINFAGTITTSAIDLPPLELEDVHDFKWFSTNSNLSNSSLNLDCEDGGTITRLVNPNAVMPALNQHNGNTCFRSPSPPPPTTGGGHLTFSPSTIKISAANNPSAAYKLITAVKKDLLTRLDTSHIKKEPRDSSGGDMDEEEEEEEDEDADEGGDEDDVDKCAPVGDGSIPDAVEEYEDELMLGNKRHLKTLTIRNNTSTKSSTTSALLSFRNTINHVRNGDLTVTPSVRKSLNNSSSNSNNNNNTTNCHNVMSGVGGNERFYPKPAYSYSCLIAMALKNSRSGSLPVSEIYNFMCRHFPYFLTAPNGWKNSVRHNLSLNKCFEKIEKPAMNGSHRKGCLWTMNPAKITKMDEEVQKWSRKDPTTIRKAMVNPEDLESLERGELKFSSSFDDPFGDSCGSADSGEEGGGGGVCVKNVHMSNPDSPTVVTADTTHPSNVNRSTAATTYQLMTVPPATATTTTLTTTTTTTHPIDGKLMTKSVQQMTCGAPVGKNRRYTTDSDLDIEFSGSDLDLEVSDAAMYEDMKDDEQILRMEMALAKKELMEYENRENNKRRRTYIIHH